MREFVTVNTAVTVLRFRYIFDSEKEKSRFFRLFRQHIHYRVPFPTTYRLCGCNIVVLMYLLS